MINSDNQQNTVSSDSPNDAVETSVSDNTITHPQPITNTMSTNNDIPTVPADDESAAIQMNNATAADVESATGSSTTNTTAAALASANLNSGTDFAATTNRTPYYIMMKDTNGLCMTFKVSSGEVYSITTPEGRKVTATERAQHVQTQFDEAGNLISCSSDEGKLVCSSDVSGGLILECFPPDAFLRFPALTACRAFRILVT